MKVTKKKSIIALILILGLVIGCPKITRVYQPSPVDDYCFAETEVDIIQFSAVNTGYLTIGIHVPNDWTISRVFYNGDYSGTMSYDQDVTNSLPSPDPGYKWLGFISDNCFNNIPTNDSITAYLDIKTGKKGYYLIDYVVGGSMSCNPPSNPIWLGAYSSFDNPIQVKNIGNICKVKAK